MFNKPWIICSPEFAHLSLPPLEVESMRAKCDCHECGGSFDDPQQYTVIIVPILELGGVISGAGKILGTHLFMKVHRECIGNAFAELPEIYQESLDSLSEGDFADSIDTLRKV